MGLAVIIPDVSFADVNLGQVTLTENVPIKALQIVANDSYIGAFAQLSVSFYPINTNQRGVTWSITSGSEYASISNSGVLTINDGADNSEITVKVTSSSDPSVNSTKVITVTYSGDQPQPQPTGKAIINDGSSYLNLAEHIDGDVSWSAQGSIEIVFSVLTGSSKQRSIFGVAIDSPGASSARMTHLLAFKDTYQLRIDDANPINNNRVTYNKESLIRYYRNKSQIMIEQDGESVFNGTADFADTVQSVGRFGLFALASHSVAGVFVSYNNPCENIKVYSAKYWDTNGNLVFDVEPYNNNDVITMYDKVSRKPLTPMGGSFTLVD